MNMTFSCDGSHYIDHQTFFEKLETFGTTEKCELQQASVAEH
jgi:hypothetical protein